MYISTRKALVVKPKNKVDYNFITDLLKKLGIGTSILINAKLEDIGMLKLMSKVDKSSKANRSEIVKSCLFYKSRILKEIFKRHCEILKKSVIPSLRKVIESM